MPDPTTKHPPGSWRVTKSGISVDIDAGRNRVRLESGTWEAKSEICRMIAATPDLLAASKTMIAASETVDLGAMQRAIDQMRAAVHAATTS